MKKLSALIISLILIFTCGCAQLTDSNTPTDAAGTLTVYFIDVGQADCALVTLNGSTMLIDGGNVEDGPDVVSFIKKLGIDTLDTVVSTHAHEDHVGGLSTVIDNFTVKRIYSPVLEYSSGCFNDFIEASEKQCGVTRCTKGVNWNLGGAGVAVLWPIAPENEDTNNTSIVLKLTYNTVSFLFTGDLEHDAEARLVETGADLSANVLKVGHHGSDTSSSYLFLRSVLPQIGIISCGKGNSYGHPHDEVVTRLNQAEAKLFRTDTVGTVTVTTDGYTIDTRYGDTVESTLGEQATPALSSVTYIGNKSSKTFHLETCTSLPKKENQIAFASREEAVNNNYTPCGRCKP